MKAAQILFVLSAIMLTIRAGADTTNSSISSAEKYITDLYLQMTNVWRQYELTQDTKLLKDEYKGLIGWDKTVPVDQNLKIKQLRLLAIFVEKVYLAQSKLVPGARPVTRIPPSVVDSTVLGSNPDDIKDPEKRRQYDRLVAENEELYKQAMRHVELKRLAEQGIQQLRIYLKILSPGDSKQLLAEIEAVIHEEYVKEKIMGKR